MKPVTKLWAVKSNLKRVVDYDKNPDKTIVERSLENEIDYVRNGEKTLREQYVEGINCHPISVYDEFTATKRAYLKTDKRLAYHGIISFPHDRRITPDIAFEIGKEFVRRCWGDRFEALVSLHMDTDNYHCHYLINSVSFVDGKKITGDERNWYRLRHVADEIFKEHGLWVDKDAELGFSEPTYKASREKKKLADGNSSVTKEESGKLLSFEPNKTYAERPTRRDLARAAIDDAIGQSRSLYDFKYHLSRMGYTLGDSPTRKYWTITYGSTKAIRVYQLGEEYSETAITRRLDENKNNPYFVPIIPGANRERMYKFKTRCERAIEKGGNGIKGTYIKICVRMEFIYSYYRTPNYRRMHPAVREAIEWIDRLNDETFLCCKNNINNLDDLERYRLTVEDKIKSAADDRRECRNAVRRVGVTDEEVEENKRKIAAQSQELKRLRNELSLCEDIRKRSPDLQKRVERVLADEARLRAAKMKKSQRNKSRLR
ncbi:MAG: relaxase/mobilization nuclease domain-containing protein [Clostridia bacterium]|nr:relaxase/mobilization nuclease domain-containing protein [Clostridia bacterium]